jgi:hypothetical protein
MAKQTINIGTTANDGTGDSIRAAFNKANANFTELYADPIPLVGITGGTPATATSTGTKGEIKYDSSYVYICVATNSWIRVTRAAW